MENILASMNLDIKDYLILGATLGNVFIWINIMLVFVKKISVGVRKIHAIELDKEKSMKFVNVKVKWTLLCDEQ